MHQSGERHRMPNKIFMKALGIWPREKFRLAVLQCALISMLTVPHIFMQFAVFITTQYSMTLFIKVTSLALPFATILSIYYGLLFKSQAILNLNKQMQDDWKMLSDKAENVIIENCLRDYKMYFYIMLTYISFIVVAFSCLQFLPIILDAVLPLDEPRPRTLLITMEYFVSQTQYFYITVVHEIVFITVCSAVFCGISAQILVYIFHSCSLLKVVKHRVQHSVEDSVLHSPNSIKEHAIRKRIKHAAIVYRRAQDFSHLITASLNEPLSVVSVLEVISLSINLYGVVEATTISKNIENFLVCVVPIIGLLFYMFMAMYFGEMICDNNTEVFNVLYGTSWYLMPVSSQKLLLFLLRRATNDLYLKIGHILEGKMESFAMLVNASLSYVAVMYNCAGQ